MACDKTIAAPGREVHEINFNHDGIPRRAVTRFGPASFWRAALHPPTDRWLK